MLTKKKKITKTRRKNPAIGLKNDINNLIEVLEDLKITLLDPTSKFFEQDLKEENKKLQVLAAEIARKIED